MPELELKNRDTSLPLHIGIIMDGNGRWANSRGLPREAGHNKGADVFEKIVEHALKRKVQYLTVYAFSTENFKRPQKEVDAIMNLMRKYLKEQTKRDNKEVRVNFIGDIENLPEDIRESINDLERENLKKVNTQKMILNIAFNYGGRQDILTAAKRLAQKYKSNEIDNLDSFTEDAFSKLLYTETQPEVDLVIRTSGEERISNFLVWQSAYAELIFAPELWPDFKPKHFDNALKIYAERNRRLGGV